MVIYNLGTAGFGNYASFLQNVQMGQLAAKISGDISLIITEALRPEILWVILPMLTTLVAVELYFGRYKGESLGGDSETSNGILLIWVGINEIQYLSKQSLDSFSNLSYIVAVFIFAYGVLASAISFFKILPENIVFDLSSTLLITYLAFLSVVFVYSEGIFSVVSPVSIVALFLIIAAIFWVIQSIEPHSYL